MVSVFCEVNFICIASMFCYPQDPWAVPGLGSLAWNSPWLLRQSF
jgi:hypothetical protein